MTADEIRKLRDQFGGQSNRQVSAMHEESLLWAAEIAAQLAELNATFSVIAEALRDGVRVEDTLPFTDTPQPKQEGLFR